MLTTHDLLHVLKISDVERKCKNILRVQQSIENLKGWYFPKCSMLIFNQGFTMGMCFVFFFFFFTRAYKLITVCGLREWAVVQLNSDY